MAVIGKKAVSTVHPRFWPYSEIDNANVFYYTGNSSSGRGSDVGNFWSNVFQDTFGSYNDVAKDADTYYTYVDISASHGVMGTIMFPQIASNASAFHTIKLTTDGSVEEFRTLTTTLDAGDRYWIGYAKEVTSSAEVRGAQGRLGYGRHLFGKGSEGVDRYNNGCTLTSAQQCLHEGIPVHSFETSLKVEVKCSVASSTNAHNENGGVLVFASPNL